MIYFEQRDSKVWTSNSTKDVGPGSYNNGSFKNKETHNHGKVPFGVCGERFKSELAMKFEALPGPGHYKEFQLPNKKGNSSYVSRSSRKSVPRSRPSVFKPDVDDISLASTVDNSKLRLFSSERANNTQEIEKKKKRMLRSRNPKSVSAIKSANSIPFKRENDNIQGVGPGCYEPNVETIHKKAPTTKIMQSTLLDKKQTMKDVNRIIKSVRKQKEPTIHQQISTHKLLNQNAVFASRTSRTGKIEKSPGPGMYEAGYTHSYVQNHPEGFGSTSERQYLVNRNVLKSPFTEPTNVANPGVGTYGKIPKFGKKEDKSTKKGRISLSQNRAVLLANAKGVKVKDLEASSSQMVLSPGPGQYDLGFQDELKMLDQKLSARYKKIPFGSSRERFKIKEYNENIKKNKQKVENALIEEVNKSTESLPQEKKNRNKHITQQIREIEASRPHFMFQSQSSRFDETQAKSKKKKKFQARIVNENVQVKEADSMNISRNKSYVLLKGPVSYAGQDVGFNMLSPRFERSKNEFKPGPGEYNLESRGKQKAKLGQRRSKLVFEGNRLEEKKKSQRTKIPHAYGGHSEMGKKSFNKLLTPRIDV